MSDACVGGCLCGGVRYRISAPPQGVLACHCRQCRRMSGHFYAATAVPKDAFELTEQKTLKWFASSVTSRRGFCAECGSSLFFDHGPEEPIGISAGSFDDTAGLVFAAHIYVDEAGDYYTLPEHERQFTRREWSEGGWKSLRRSS